MEVTEEDHHYKPHIAILPAPGMGHVIPHLEFAKRLVSLHGFRVTFLVLTTHSSAAQSNFLRRHSITLSSSIRIVSLPNRPVSHLITPHTQIQTLISIIIRESLPDLHSTLAAASPTALVVDFFATDAFAIADNLRIPKYIFYTSTAAELAFMMYLPTFDRQILAQFVNLTDPLRVPGCNPIRIQDLVDPVRDRKSDAYKWFLQHASRFPSADGIIINTCEDLERETIKALQGNEILRRIPTPRVYPVGPLINHDAGGPAVEHEGRYWETWLDQQPPESVLYVSFGSGGTLGDEQIAELAYGLELSRQRFVWVVRKPFKENASGTYFDVGGDENVPGGYLPEGFLERVEGVGIVIPSWAPQIEILRHRSTGGFLSHCGWNSSLESIVHGVPMIAWPLYAEQKMNATLLVEEVGVAVRISDEREVGGVIGREEIERAVRLVMEGEEGKVVRGKVKEVREMVLRAIDEGGSSFDSLCEVANEWKASAAAASNSIFPSEEITCI